MEVKKEVEVMQGRMFAIGKHAVNVIFTTKAFIGNTVQILSQDCTLYVLFYWLRRTVPAASPG